MESFRVFLSVDFRVRGSDGGESQFRWRGRHYGLDPETKGITAYRFIRMVNSPELWAMDSRFHRDDEMVVTPGLIRGPGVVRDESLFGMETFSVLLALDSRFHGNDGVEIFYSLVTRLLIYTIFSSSLPSRYSPAFSVIRAW